VVVLLGPLVVVPVVSLLWVVFVVGPLVVELLVGDLAGFQN
jgi:hypothetical protein